MEYHDEDTLFKVRNTLAKHVDGGLAQADDLINELLNVGIVFREVRDEQESLEHDWHSGETFTMELPLIDKAETLRVEALAQAIAATPMNQPFGTTQGREFTAQEYLILNRAERFAQYIIEGRKTNA